MDTNITLITEDHLVTVFTIKLHTQHSRFSFHNDALIKVGILYYWWKLTTVCYLRPSRNIDQHKNYVDKKLAETHTYAGFRQDSRNSEELSRMW